MYVCGQHNLIERINNIIDNNKFPRFCILVGNTGFGKKVLSDYIARRLEATFVPCDIKVESVRETIVDAYTMAEKTLYMFFDCDSMSVAAKNTLLKVTEEPPNSAYFIMTVQDISTVLGTIISRGTVFYLEPYSQEDIQDFIKQKEYVFQPKQLSIVKQICTCPQDVMNAKDINIEEVYTLSDKFIQFIGAANMGNELKIASMLSLKKDQNDKIDPVIFMRCVMLCCNNYMLAECSADDAKVFNSIIKNTEKHLAALLSKGCNKQMEIDNWIINTHLAVSGGAI